MQITCKIGRNHNPQPRKDFIHQKKNPSKRVTRFRDNLTQNEPCKGKKNEWGKSNGPRIPKQTRLPTLPSSSTANLLLSFFSCYFLKPFSSSFLTKPEKTSPFSNFFKPFMDEWSWHEAWQVGWPLCVRNKSLEVQTDWRKPELA